MISLWLDNVYFLIAEGLPWFTQLFKALFTDAALHLYVNGRLHAPLSRRRGCYPSEPRLLNAFAYISLVKVITWAHVTSRREERTTPSHAWREAWGRC